MDLICLPVCRSGLTAAQMHRMPRSPTFADNFATYERLSAFSPLLIGLTRVLAVSVCKARLNARSSMVAGDVPGTTARRRMRHQSEAARRNEKLRCAMRTAVASLMNCFLFATRGVGAISVPQALNVAAIVEACVCVCGSTDQDGMSSMEIAALAEGVDASCLSAVRSMTGFLRGTGRTAVVAAMEALVITRT